MEVGNYTEFQKGAKIIFSQHTFYFVDDYMSYSPSNDQADI